MPKIVDKTQRRNEIAQLSKDLLLDRGIAKITVSEVAAHVGIGKGTIYQYFKSKEDIVFAIIDAFIQDELATMRSRMYQCESIKEKLYIYYDFLLNINEPERQKQFNGYLEYLSIAISSNDEAMAQFNKECRRQFKGLLESVIDEAIQKGQIIPESRELVMGLYAVEKGFAVLGGTETDLDISHEIKGFIDGILEVIQGQKR